MLTPRQYAALNILLVRANKGRATVRTTFRRARTETVRQAREAHNVGMLEDAIVLYEAALILSRKL